ncbi:MAG: ribosome recycling factor [Acidobacteriota bacterium]
MVKAVLRDVEEKLKATVEATRHELASIRAGKASLAILEPVKVDYYGTKTPLNQVATLSVPEPRLIVIQPWDPKQISVIEKAILEANLGMTPSNDGRIIRLPVPQLTEERRKDLCKKAREVGEKGKVAVRHIRHEGRAALEKKEKAKEISEDERDKGFEEIQKLHDRAVEEIAKSVSKKEADILEV